MNEIGPLFEGDTALSRRHLVCETCEKRATVYETIAAAVPLCGRGKKAHNTVIKRGAEPRRANAAMYENAKSEKPPDARARARRGGTKTDTANAAPGGVCPGQQPCPQQNPGNSRRE